MLVANLANPHYHAVTFYGESNGESTESPSQSFQGLVFRRN